MATSSFKSTSRRTSLCGGGDDSSSSVSPSSSSTTNSRVHRRTRSLSRFSRRLPEPASEYGNNPKGNFVNTTRGSAFPDISLDDLALEFFSSAQDTSNDEAKNREGRSARRSSELGRWATDTASSVRRGRSVSKQRNGNNRNPQERTGNRGDGNSSSSNNSRGKVGQTSSRRRRSLSVARKQISDSESDRDLCLSYGRHGNIKDLVGGRKQMSSTVIQGAPSGRRLERSLSLKDLTLSNDGYSSQSSALTDEETRNAQQDKFGNEKTTHTVYAQKKSEHPTDDGSGELYEALRKEFRHAVEEIRTELEQAVGRTNTTREEDEDEIHQSLSVEKQKYAAKLKLCEKRKQDLLAEIVLEEQRGRDLSKPFKEIVTDSKNAASPQRPARIRKKSNDRMSSKLVEDAEKHFLDFISNVEDTDISSFDGERSDGSSTPGCTSKARGGTNNVETEKFHSPAVPIGIDGVILPWLQWETSNDASLLRKSIAQTPANPKALNWDAEEGTFVMEMNFRQEPSCHSGSSKASSSGDLFNIHQLTTKEDGENISGGHERSQFDMDSYLQLERNQDSLFEMYKERRRINCGGLLLCAGGL